MEQYISKAAVKAEIEKRLKHNGTRAELDRSAFMAGREKEDEDILSFLDTLEVKEVEEPSNDLEEEIELVKGDYEQVDVAWNNDFDFIARHSYELGLKAKGE